MVKLVKSIAEQEASKKKKKKKKKEYADVLLTHKCFNLNAVPSRHTAVLMNDMVVRAGEILAQHDIVMEPWCTLDNLARLTIEAWTVSDPIDHKHWWMDKYLEEIGYMIWNDVSNKYFQDWYKTGVLIDVPELVKRERNPDGVSDHFANTAVAEFMKLYN